MSREGTDHSLRRPGVVVLTALFVLTLGQAAVADDIRNDLDASIDATAEIMTLSVGGSPGTTSLAVIPRNLDGKNGCNLTGGTTLVVAVSTSDSSVATVSPTSITFGSCGATPTLTVTPHGHGATTISLSQTSNNTGGSFNLAPATFTVAVAPPPNEPPTIAVIGVANGTTYEFGSVPAAVCSASDTEDGDSTFPASLGTVEGPLAAYGLGSQTASCSYTDAGGLVAAASVTYGIVDTTPPTLNLPGDLTREATSGDGAVVTYSVSASDTADPSPLLGCFPDSGALFAIGTTTVGCSAGDAAGNVRSGSFDVTVVDTTAPAVTIVTTALEGANGWFNIASSGTGGITATVTASDGVGVAGLSCDVGGTAIAGVSASGDTFSLGDGVHHVTCIATDAAGNQGSDDEVFRVDQTAPTIDPGYSASANAAGWNNTDVTVSYTCTDETSGIDPAFGCPADDVLNANGLYELHKATSDHAGNPATPSFTVRIDKSAPMISGSASPAANGAGWNNTEVTVSFTCVDVGPSGLKSCSGASTLGEGADQSVTGSATDNADNSASAIVGPINVDTTPPVISASRTAPNVYGWNNGPVTVTFACDDGSGADDSGVASLTAPQTIDANGIHSVSGTCTDLASNSASLTVEDIRIDTRAPTIAGSATPGANANGWNDTDVTVAFVCIDDPGGSGIKTDTVAGATLTEDGSGQSVTSAGDCVDVAGNAADPATVGAINIDETPPTDLEFLGGGLGDGGNYFFNFVPSGPSGCSADGAISGLASCMLDAGYSNAVGTHTITATAIDQAGNQAVRSLSYTVGAWTTKGFFQPVDMPTLSTPMLFNSAKGGSTIPLKFELFAGTTELTNTGYVRSITYAPTYCDANAVMDEIEATATGGTILRYEGGQFVYNWQTPKTPGTCYRVTMQALEGAGASIVAYVKLK